MRTEYNLEALENALNDNCGDFFKACRSCGLSLSFVRTWMGDDPKVRERITNAQNLGSMALESEAIRRAVEGDEEPIQNKQGEIVGYKTKKSDMLLVTLLKGKMKQTYQPDEQAAFVNNGIVINAMPRASSFEEWLGMATALQNGKSLPPPSLEIEDAEFSTVLPPPEEDPNMADIL